MSMRVSSSSSSCSASAISCITDQQFFRPAFRPAPFPRWHSKGDQLQKLFSLKTNGFAYRILPYPNVYSAKEQSNKEVIMVDPVEAKKLAAKEMEQYKAKERFKRRRQIEAINGAWAMIGLTTGLLIEGQTGKSIIDQLRGYIQAIIHIFPS